MILDICNHDLIWYDSDIYVHIYIYIRKTLGITWHDVVQDDMTWYNRHYGTIWYDTTQLGWLNTV